MNKRAPMLSKAIFESPGTIAVCRLNWESEIASPSIFLAPLSPAARVGLGAHAITYSDPDICLRLKRKLENAMAPKSCMIFWK